MLFFIISNLLISFFPLVLASAERLAPDGETFTLGELSGAYTDVDEDPDSPDGLWLIATSNNVHTNVLVSFPTPSESLAIGADLQEFKIFVRQYDEGQIGTPNVRIELWENGGLIRAGSDTPVSDIPSGGDIFTFTWNANELSTSDGSQVECYVFGTKTGGSPPTRNTVEVGAIEWNAEVSFVPDIDPPTWDTLTESADPLELGQTEIININIYDVSIISTVDLEFDGSNHSMSFISGDTYRYSIWTPISIGEKTYEIHMIDEFGNTATTGDQTLIVEDTTNPTISNIVESADPLELGNTETIEVDITDESSMTWVYLEFESFNYSMSFVSGITWEYTTWTPTSTGNYPYIIYANDTEGNINSDSSGDITVEDTINPSISNIVESADPLELGDTETIQVDITDESSMTWVYLEFESSNHSMSFVSGITWEYTTWIPTSANNYPYIIYANDTSGNINSDSSGDITVEDTVNPSISNIVESADPLELGNTETIQVDITDESSMTWVYLEFESSNHSMSFVSGITWEYTTWQPASLGNYPYIIYANDTEGNINFDSSGDITVVDTTKPNFDFIFEYEDPSEFGEEITISAWVSDNVEVDTVLLEFEGSNHTMEYVSGIVWTYINWLPTSVGNYPYTVWANDTSGNLESYSDDITVVDTTKPVIEWPYEESADPLELGDIETIRVNITDLSDLTWVYIEFEGSNHSMSFVSVNLWEYTSWQPLSVGYYDYRIWANDTSGNIKSRGGDLMVIDTINPVISNIIESNDPLELGNTETIQVNITDLSPITWVYLEFESSNHSMSFVSGITWEYTTWQPTFLGNYPYTIYANDTSGNIDFDSSGDITVEDTTNPTISNIVESVDPLELGDTEIIQVNITDESSMTWVYLEFESSNYSMSFVSGITWEYTTWQPSSIGNYPYIIYANDTEGNIAFDSSGDITVEDTTNPTISNIVENSDPLELGFIEIISVDITDESSMTWVYLEYEGSNHSMYLAIGIKWEWNNWVPTSIGNYLYTIYANDTEGNISFDSSGDITVIDTTDPVISDIVESADPLELGNIEIIQVNITDESSMIWVYLEFESSNHSMSFVSGITWEYTTWQPSSIGNYPYIIYANDTEGNIAFDSSGDITVEVGEQEEDKPTWDTLIESDDPLELGNNETIHINVYDASIISFVYFEYNDNNYSMNFEFGDTYNYTNWLPISIGIKIYQIHMIDEFGNTNQTEILNITVIDTTNPVISNIIESADPLGLGNTEIIHVDITDLSPIYFVYLEFEGSNYSMVLDFGITWNYTTWQPSSIGNYPYIIWVNDTSGNINFYEGSITVLVEVIAPTWDTLIFETNPLELGNLFTVWINVYDNTNVSIVKIVIKGINYTMINLYNDTWVYFNYQFESSGSYDYSIWMIDYYSNVNFTQGIIQVISTPMITMSVAIIFLLIGMMIYFYLKGERSMNLFLIILTINSFSAIIGFMAMTILGFPFTPLLQTFFILIQTILFMLITLEIFSKKEVK